MIKQFYLTKVQQIRVTMDLGFIAMKKYTTFLKVARLEPYSEMQFSVITKTLVERRGLTPMQKCTRPILQSTIQ